MLAALELDVQRRKLAVTAADEVRSSDVYRN